MLPRIRLIISILLLNVCINFIAFQFCKFRMKPKSRYNTNTEVTLQLAEIASQHGGPFSCLQTKITALINANLMVTFEKRQV